MPYTEIQKSLDADFPDGRNYYWKSLYLNELSDDLIDVMSEYAAIRPSLLTSIDIWALGGAVNRVQSDETALSQRQASFLLNVESNWDDPKDTENNLRWTRAFYDDVKKYSNGAIYLNFPGFAEEGETMLKGSYANNYRKLQAIKSKYDPKNLFQGNFNIKPISETIETF